VVVFGLLGGKRLDGWTALFLVTTVLTSVTGFLFPFHKFLPSHGVGIVSLVGASDCDLCSLRPATRQGLAPWLRSQRGDCAVPECVRIDRAAFHEGAGAESNGADGVRTALFGAQIVCMALFVVLGIGAAIKFRSEAVRTA